MYGTVVALNQSRPPKEPGTFCSIAQHRHQRRGPCSTVARDGAELLTLAIGLDWDAAEQSLVSPRSLLAEAKMISNDRT
jgi:hypothetical protein